MGEFIELRDAFNAKLYCESASNEQAWAFVEVVALFHYADAASNLFRVGIFRCVAESAVSTVVFPDGVRWCMETDFYCTSLIQLFDLCFDWLTICYNIRQWNRRHRKPHIQTRRVQRPAFFFIVTGDLPPQQIELWILNHLCFTKRKQDDTWTRQTADAVNSLPALYFFSSDFDR